MVRLQTKQPLPVYVVQLDRALRVLDSFAPPPSISVLMDHRVQIPMVRLQTEQPVYVVQLNRLNRALRVLDSFVMLKEMSAARQSFLIFV